MAITKNNSNNNKKTLQSPLHAGEIAKENRNIEYLPTPPYSPLDSDKGQTCLIQTVCVNGIQSIHWNKNHSGVHAITVYAAKIFPKLMLNILQILQICLALLRSFFLTPDYLHR